MYIPYVTWFRVIFAKMREDIATINFMIRFL